jgi:hypothetical protein
MSAAKQGLYVLTTMPWVESRHFIVGGAQGWDGSTSVFFYRGDIAKRGDIAIGLAAIANV